MVAHRNIFVFTKSKSGWNLNLNWRNGHPLFTEEEAAEIGRILPNPRCTAKQTFIVESVG